MRLITSKQEIKTAIDVLAYSYAQAPNITWMLQPSERNLKVFFSSVVKDAAAKRGVYLTNNKKGVLILYNMETNSWSIAAIFRKIHLLLFVMGLKQGLKVMKQQKIQTSHRPSKGFYALALAVSDDEDKWQTRLELKKEFSKLAKSMKLPVYAETTNIRFAKLYESLGFECYHQIQHPYVNLNIWYLQLLPAR